MKKHGCLIFTILILIALLISCETTNPQWIGIWVDDTSLPLATITLDFNRAAGTVTLDNSDPEAEAWLTIITGSLGGDENTLTATISSIYQESNSNPDGITLKGPLLEAYLLTLGLPGLSNSVSYSIVTQGDTITLILQGELISVLTEGASDTLQAVKQ